MVTGAHSRKLGFLASASFIVLAATTPGRAQTVEIPEPPVNSMIDSRGVDLTSGQLMVDFTPLTIGDPKNGLKQSLYYPGLNGFRHDQMITATADDYDMYGYAYGNHVTIATGQVANGFTWNGSIYAPDKGDGAALTISSDLKTWTYTDRNGDIISLDRTHSPYYNQYIYLYYINSYVLDMNSTNYYGGVDGVATTITRPDGFKTQLNYKTGSYVYAGYGTVYATRLQSSTTSTGYQLKFNYLSNALAQASANDWMAVAGEQTINNAIDYCDPAADVCSGLTQSWPTMTVGRSTSGTNGILSFTDPVGRTGSYTFDSSGRIIGYRRPNSSSDTVTYGYYTGSTAISSVSLAGIGTWGYTFSYNASNHVLSSTVTTPTIATPLSVSANYDIRQPLTVSDENGHTTTFTYDTNGRVKTRAGDGTGSNSAAYSYDTRGNLTAMVLTPKSGSGLGTLTGSATYPAVPCASTATCNKPVTTTNSENQVTNYFYNANGTPDYVQAPAPTTGAARPEVHYTYTTAQAQVKNAAGSIVGQGDVLSLPAGSTTCASGAYASCAPTDQVISQVAYAVGTGATNLGVQSSTVAAGAGSPAATSAYTYDNLGDVASVTDPVGNVTTTSYAMDRQPTLAVGPSIDGSGTSNRRAAQYHYNADGLPDSVTTGAYNPTTQALTARIVTSTTYDNQGRKTLASVSDGSTTYALSQYSYNGAGRIDCTATRMNPAAYGSPPSSACTLGTQGSDGPDRITHFVYDNSGQTLKTQSAYGVSGQQRDDATYTYTNHGLPETMTDPKGNVTSFAYDGHDRLLRTCYQGSLFFCQAGASSDYVELGYNAAGRLISRSIRGAAVSTKINYTYDYLGRVTNIAYPGGGTFDQPVTLAYDNLGRQLSATDGSGHSATFSYDALGDVLTQGDAISARTMLYDAAGRRTRLTWSDGRYVTYDYDGASDLTAIKENGGTALASFAYDDIGRRATLTRGNGVTTSYSGYTPLGVGSIIHDLAGTANDLTIGLTYTAAGQIRTRTLTGANTAWSFGENYPVNRNYSANSLNQYTASGGITPTYDSKGNLTSAGVPGYAYSTKNELTQRVDTSASFYHDPLGRLDTLTAAAGTTRFQYDGANISTELDGATTAILKRYVFGSGADEPLVQYEGSDFSTKRFLVSDERGSVIAVTDPSGNPVAINAYDEYGIPASTNQGRFQYTGQAWIPELGMYSYKARIYSPTLGRFLQTDPAGYPDGPNWYAYVNNDPVNGTDPSGMFIASDGAIEVTGSRSGGISSGGGSLFNDLDFVAVWAAAAANAAVHSNSIIDAINKSKSSQSGRGPCSPNNVQLAGSGRVDFKFTEAGGAALFGYTHAEGSFTTANGYSGHFTTSSKVLGTPTIGGGAGTGYSRDLSTFSGDNNNITANLGRIAISDNYDPATGEHVGETNGVATPGVALGLSRSTTTLRNVICPAGR